MRDKPLRRGPWLRLVCFSRVGLWCSALALLAFLAGFQAAPAGDPGPAPLFEGVKAALAKGQVSKTPVEGFAGAKPYSECPSQGALLVGFDVGLGQFGNTERIYALRPI